ncbi:FtsK/SpoIIIE domain-containing protein [uncultured Clostridium sp.]|uniref:FtsK/SpoIIIE domain-containing protein n=1 Tax=uncultured Clostridium sp. TaxID=59620 RepID=UPI0028F0FA53|nr:FtsK/SpoIIIE domain-containing protein [uncultured Clostridium sp.]
MIIELLATSAGYSIYKNWDKLMIRKKWKEITFSKNEFTNKLEKTLKIWSIERTEYGHLIKIELPYSYTLECLEKDLSIFKEGLGYKSIQLKTEGNMVDMYCIKEFKFKDFKPIKLPPNKLLIADGLINPIVVDMNRFPHMLIGGDTGTGKSRILLLILTNLIKYCNNIELYLLQVRKNDLGVFSNCKQVKVNSKTLEEVLEALEKIDKECKRRESLIDNTKGYYNIEDYNRNSYNKLKYIYVFIEEFSFLNTSKGDSGEEKKLKAKCLKHVKTLANVGRSSGAFLVTSLQKPTSDSIPSDIKAQLCTRVALKLSDIPTSVVVLGNNHASDLGDREVIVRTNNEEIGYSYTIDHYSVMENINHRIIEKPKDVAPIVPKKQDILEILNAINI